LSFLEDKEGKLGYIDLIMTPSEEGGSSDGNGRGFLEGKETKNKS